MVFLVTFLGFSLSIQHSLPKLTAYQWTHPREPSGPNTGFIHQVLSGRRLKRRKRGFGRRRCSSIGDPWFPQVDHLENVDSIFMWMSL